MDYLVEQLRTLNRGEWSEELLDEAASEIERLRMELGNWIDVSTRAEERLATVTLERDEKDRQVASLYQKLCEYEKNKAIKERV